MAKTKAPKKLKEYPVPTDRHALVIVNPWGVPPEGFTRCTPQQWRGFYNNLASWVECACGIQPIGMWRTSEGGREQVFVDMPFGGDALTTTIPGTNDRSLTKLGRRLLGAHYASRFFWCPRALNAWQGHVVSVYEYDWKRHGDLDRKFDHFIQDTPALTDEFVCRRGDNYPLPDAPLPNPVKWLLKLPPADAWATPAPINASLSNVSAVVTPPPLSQSPPAAAASPSPAPETFIKRDPYEEEDELMQHVKNEMEDPPVKFEDQADFKEEDNDPRTMIKRDPYEEENEQMDGLRDLERDRNSEERQHVERWQPYETPLLPGMRQRDGEPICVKQESEDPRPLHEEAAEGRINVKQEEQSRPLYNEEEGRRILADLLRMQREERVQREEQSNQAVQQVKREPVDSGLVPSGRGRNFSGREGREYRRERERSQTLASSSSPVRVKQEPDDGRRNMMLASPTSQVDDFLSSCLPGGQERGERQNIDDNKARWVRREYQRLNGDRHELQWDRRINGDMRRRNDERRREGERQHDEDAQRDQRRPIVKREPVDQSLNDGRTRDPRRTQPAPTADPRIRIKREMDDGSGMFKSRTFDNSEVCARAGTSLSGRSDQWKRVKREM
ncbi:uncharacterized protein EV420DRAFT_80482 [Desarmillaria tabescens]|uniref:Uncharacterized protein n=1 Tax=Armillaria tabescens TaxID=1929756 RepID=A0AA39NQI2_ARMTA|nr:uncharacterized protein EV420DRAFT_80482 [Desarmillaria tabescens]KAK0469941.1 hypothetical protein EV420DRAFT_80482 [Desarmillaria tabescens]